MKRLVLALIISLLIHLSQYGLVTYWPAPKMPQNETTETTEFEVIENPAAPAERTKPIVKSIVDKNQIDMNKPADFLAEDTNRTRLQTRAQESGQFRNSEAPKQPKQPSFDANSDPFRPQMAQTSRSEYLLPNDIQVGSAVNLNTDADIYASFYNRVTDLFYIRWSQKLEAIWMRLSDETKRGLSGRSWTTDVEIILDARGQDQKGIVMKKSGFSSFDSAAIFGFKDAAFFPNPPKAKVDPDGRIRLRYRINIQVR
jgi:hypothetical protein